MSGLGTEDVITLAGAAGVLLGWGIFAALGRIRSERPAAVIRRRATELAALASPAGSLEGMSGRGSLALPITSSAVAAMVTRLRGRVQDLGGPTGVRRVAGAATGGGVVALVLLMIAGQPALIVLPLLPLAAALAAGAAYLVLRARFRRQFLDGFPEAIDLVVRAVRAGVPVHVAIQTAGSELSGPLGRECRRMSDALALGVDQGEVFAGAADRIRLPEFNFFVVCLELQRETGGPLAETLENLSAIIRSRAEVRLKSRALTAEARTSAKVIAMVPVATIGGLLVIGGDYLDVLFHTQKGHRMMAVAAGLIVTGQLVITRLAKLKD